jgi:small subunit ribosomal protein S1
LEEERRGVREQILDRMNVGDFVTGTISNIVDFGAFVDLNGIDGLIHISELSWSHVNHPGEVLTINQEVTVKVLDIDRDRQRISLGLKQTQKDPWQEVFENRQVNEIVHGKVTKLVSFGAFVEIEEGVEGLIHISELAQHHVEDPSEVLRNGLEVNVKIIEIDPERRRLSLSLKRLEPEYRIHEDAMAHELAVEEEAAEAEGEEPAVADAEALEGTEAVVEGAETVETDEASAETDAEAEAAPDTVAEAEAASEADVVADEASEADVVADEPSAVVETAEVEAVVEAAEEATEAESAAEEVAETVAEAGEPEGSVEEAPPSTEELDSVSLKLSDEVFEAE